MCRLWARLHKSGQSTAELAILGSVILVVLGSLLKYGQLLNKQQEVRMHAFRQVLNKAYHDYDNGDGFGGASYSSTKDVHIVSPMRDYYDGSQRKDLSAKATVLWDPDLMYATEDNLPNSYIEIGGIEANLGQRVAEGVSTEASVHFLGAEEKYYMNSSGIESSLYADVEEHLVTTIKIQDDSDVVIEQDNTYTRDETWTTAW